MGCIVPCMKSEEQWIEEYMTVLEGVFERYVVSLERMNQ